MMNQIVCEIILSLTCIGAIIYYNLTIKHIEKITSVTVEKTIDSAGWRNYEVKRTTKFHNRWFIMSAGGAIFTVIAAICSVLDGLTNESYIGYIVVSILLMIILFAFLFSYIMCRIGIKNKIVLFYNDYSDEHYYYNRFITKYRSGVSDTLITGLFTAIFPAVVFGLSIYTLILIVA